MQSIVTTMGDVNKNTQEIAGAVQQQSAATSEISPGRARHRGRGTAYAWRDQGGRRDQPVRHTDALGLARPVASGRAARHTVENFLREVAAADQLKRSA
jgi:methyl-accepting chemotaxis protein